VSNSEEEDDAARRAPKAGKRRWGYYDFGPFTLGVGPVESEHGGFALVLTVGEESFPLAYFDDAASAKESLSNLDAGIHELHDQQHSPPEDPPRRRRRPREKGV
jgi:hypothetical protein